MKKMAFLFLLIGGLGYISESSCMGGFDAIIEDEYVPPRTLSDDLNDADNPQQFYKNFVHKAITKNYSRDIKEALMLRGKYTDYPCLLTTEELQKCRQLVTKNKGACCCYSGSSVCYAGSIATCVAASSLYAWIPCFLGGAFGCYAGRDLQKSGQEVVAKIDQLLQRHLGLVVVTSPSQRQMIVPPSFGCSERGTLGGEPLNSYGALN